MSYDIDTLMHWIDVTIKDAHQRAFASQREFPREFRPGDVVWLYDHYNTAIVLDWRDSGKGMPREYAVRTTDADGLVHEYWYKPAWLALADRMWQFQGSD